MDRETVIAQCEWAIKQTSPTIIESKMFYEEVLSLLKEQEAKTVIKIAKRFNDCDLTGYCPFCSRPLIKDWAENYCGYCGKPVLWEGR